MEKSSEQDEYGHREPDIPILEDAPVLHSRRAIHNVNCLFYNRRGCFAEIV